MCGICGFVNLDGTPVDGTVLARMNGRLRHRGPDSEGYFISGNVGMANRRLKVIDVEGGDQPIGCENKTVWTVFNGELYGFKDIRKNLESQEHKFSTNSDTEIIVHLYEEHGEEFSKHLKGMFAVALFDSRTSKLVLVRDRKGKKPLYYYHDTKLFAFASEVKALLAHPSIRRMENPDALPFFLALGYVPSPFSAFKGISKLEPASQLVMESGKARVSTYWTPSHGGGGTQASASDLEDLIKVGVHRRLYSDVPLGAFLSGGIDSSLVVAFACERAAGMKTFCIGFDEDTFDESKYAEQVARHLGTEHKTGRISNTSVQSLLERAVEILDEPLADTSFFPTLVLSEFTRKSVTVALSGDGGDELFLGYPTFQAERLTPYALALPGPIRRGIVRAMSRLPIRQSYYPIEYRFLQFIKGIEHGLAARNQTWISGFTPDEVSDVCGVDSRYVFDFLMSAVRNAGFDDGLDALRWLYFRFYLGDGVLAKMDRASMAVSLEVRCPLLDDDLIDFVFRRPASGMFNWLKTKPMLRALAKPRLPGCVTGRSKHGFSMPVVRLLRNEFRETIANMDERLPLPLNRKLLKRYVADHLAGKADNSRKLWPLVVLARWRERWLG